MATAINTAAPFDFAPGASILVRIAALFSVRKPTLSYTSVVIGM